MFLTYFKTAYRLLLKNKLFTIVNLVSLSTGLASIMTLTILVLPKHDEGSFVQRPGSDVLSQNL